MHTGLEDGRKRFPAMAAYFAERARGAAGIEVHLIGGAHKAAELDAKRAIDQGTRLAASL